MQTSNVKDVTLKILRAVSILKQDLDLGHAPRGNKELSIYVNANHGFLRDIMRKIVVSSENLPIDLMDQLDQHNVILAYDKKIRVVSLTLKDDQTGYPTQTYSTEVH